ncbi:hypothetical protein ACFTZI_05610 [Streptomyces decoyicus]|uniref:hypothetical protein n=1 Tax=Streptomyces decoyicus TaxID=249567 RepID=UPI0036386870
MIDRIRRGHSQLPSGQFHGISFNIPPLEFHSGSGGRVVVRLSAVLAVVVVISVVFTETTFDATQSAFLVTMQGFAWHARFHLSWNRRK